MGLLGLEILPTLMCLLSIAFGGFLRGFLGFGAALVIVPCLSMVLPPVVAIGILVLIELPNILYLVPSSIRDANFKVLKPMLLGLVLSVPIGTILLISTEPKTMRMVIAIILLFTVALLASGWRLNGRIGNGVFFGAGTLGGFIQGSAGVGGPPLVTALMSLPDSSANVRANIIVALSFLSIMNFIVLLFHGKITSNILFFSLLSAPLYVLLNFIGAKFFSGYGNIYFRRAALVVISSIALLTLYLNAF